LHIIFLGFLLSGWMMRGLLGLLLTLVLLIASPLLHAVRVHSIYQAEIPVSSESVEDRLQAEQDALAEVLVKMSGNSQILDNNPNLASNLKNADNFVEETSYASLPGVQKSAHSLLLVRFDEESVNRLLHDTGAPVWGQYRSLILVWLAFQSFNRAPDIVDPSTSTITKLLKKTAKHRGLPVIFPMMDVTDLTQVSINDISNPVIEHLQQASARYASNAILVGNIAQNAISFTGHWQLILGAEHWSWDITGKTMQEVMTGIIGKVTDTFASRYGVLLSTTVESQLDLIVVGVKQYTDLLRLMKYVQQLAAVEAVQIKNISEDEVTLDVSLRGKKEAFIQAVLLGKNLQALSAMNLSEGALEYKWMH
jgi:hypothetical protein